MRFAPISALLVSFSLAACTAGPGERIKTASPADATRVTIQILAINDFHGHLEPPQGETRFAVDGASRSARLGGAAQLGAVLAAARSGHSVTVAAGDLIGGSPLVSSLFLDEPSIRVLSEIGLEIASVGNHEFDRGTAELRRMQQGGCDKFTRREPCALEPFAGADFAYLAANVVDTAGRPFFPGTAMREFAGAKVGFIGLTLKETPILVTADATEGLTFLDEAETANKLAARLRQEGADAVVLLLHQGGSVEPSFNLDACPELAGPIVAIVERLDPTISLVVSGHTHRAYVCSMETRSGESLLLTSAGRHGGFVTDISMVVDPAGDRVVRVAGRNVPVEANAGLHPEADAIVRRYVEAAAPLANRAVGPIGAPENGQAASADCMDRPAQNLVADAHLAAAREAMDVPVDLALVNSGGVRTDLSGADDGVLSYGEIAAMQPFNNGIVVLGMTGANLKAVLEQQFCHETPATVCQSMLLPSANAAYAVDLSRAPAQRVIDLQIGGRPIDDTREYRVAVNSFLAGGGDGFSRFADAPQLGLAGFDVDALEAYVAGGRAVAPACGRVRNRTPAS